MTQPVDDLFDDMNDHEWLEFVKAGFPDIDFSLENLMVAADTSARFRNHVLEWEILTPHNALGTCVHCGAFVQCLTRPMPNQIDIGGPAVAINCGD